MDGARDELLARSRLAEIARHVELAHADAPSLPEGLAALLAELADTLGSHLDKEEQILFPLSLAGRGPLALMPVQVVAKEHEDHAGVLSRIRHATHDLELPEDACRSWRELYRAIGIFESELLEHIRIEEGILFRRALLG